MVANDIDPSERVQHLHHTRMRSNLTIVHKCLKMCYISVAAVATKMNCELNDLEPLTCLTENMIGLVPDQWDLILLGDMFYDEVLADGLHQWLQMCIITHGTHVLIGDPGRAQFESHDIRKRLLEQARFELPDSVKEENYGLTSSTVWRYIPDL